MNCDKCNSKRVVSAGAKCSDMFYAEFTNEVLHTDYNGYVPHDLGIGGGDYIDIKYCMDCGKLQGKFPLPTADIEKDSSEDEAEY
ncbi:hypothetical protein UFOVP1290_289 [uncultured Caudovirales phage]|uniref:Uncharacterized protein n=1 Tax=uncultured Caudovirales phage TaxID=2100421 RepID=A0A6J5RIB7_9CAUD|nr:hypothetical protein UFOVP1290_289 [uncultured Caudovirales phage]